MKNLLAGTFLADQSRCWIWIFASREKVALWKTRALRTRCYYDKIVEIEVESHQFSDPHILNIDKNNYF